MNRSSSQMHTEDEARLMDGEGVIRLVNILSPEEMHGRGRLFAVTIMPPGSSVGKHFHRGDFETYYILSGRAGVDDNGTYCELGPGDMTQCHDGAYHSIRNIGNCDLRYLAVILYSAVEKDNTQK